MSSMMVNGITDEKVIEDFLSQNKGKNFTTYDITKFARTFYKSIQGSRLNFWHTKVKDAIRDILRSNKEVSHRVGKLDEVTGDINDSNINVNIYNYNPSSVVVTTSSNTSDIIDEVIEMSSDRFNIPKRIVDTITNNSNTVPTEFDIFSYTDSQSQDILVIAPYDSVIGNIITDTDVDIISSQLDGRIRLSPNQMSKFFAESNRPILYGEEFRVQVVNKNNENMILISKK